MPRPNGFTHVKQQRTRCEDTEQSEQPARSGAATDGSTAPNEQQQLNIVPVAALPSRYSHAELAVLLWSTDYVGLLLHELIQYPDVAVRSLTCERAPSFDLTLVRVPYVQESVIALVSGMRSRRACGLADDRAALLRLSTICSTLARERSQKIIPFSVVARALSWLMQRVPTRVWAVCTYSLLHSYQSHSYILFPRTSVSFIFPLSSRHLHRMRCVASR